MRREFILVLLGIICVSTLSSLLSGYVPIEPDKILLDTVEGSVGAGNFSYWQLGHTGPLVVVLTSLSGDADLYVADTSKPGYELDRNNFSSATCGLDVVEVPPDFPRPIGIGVFGYWSHMLSEYNIKIYFDTTIPFKEVVWGTTEATRHGKSDMPDFDRRVRDRIAAKKNEDESNPRFLRLLGILNMILEMFVL